MLKLAGASFEVIATAIEEAGGLDKLEKLQQHKNEDIYKLAYSIIDKYFTSTVSEQTCLLPISVASLCCESLLLISVANLYY